MVMVVSCGPGRMRLACCVVLYHQLSLWRADVCSFTSLVPRPFHRPVLIACSMHKNGGERPGPFYHVNDVSVYLGRETGGGSPIKSAFCICVLHFEPRVVCFASWVGE